MTSVSASTAQIELHFSGLVDVFENYGQLTLNINPDSIYTGALGGAMFAWRAVVEEGRTAEARPS